MAKNTHKGHRERMLERIEKHGWESLSEHEILEVALFFSIPRINTNEIAHALIEKFGSLKGVLDADEKALMAVRGIGPKTAFMLKMFPEILRRYLTDESDKVYRYDTIGKIGEYLYRKFVGVDREQLYMMMFNNRLNLLDCVQISEGVINCSEVMMRKISEQIIHRNASLILLAHNHPNGMAIPSQSDRENTEMLRTQVENMGVQLLDHLVFADQKYVSILRKEYGAFRVSPISQKYDVPFFEHFYEGSETGEYRVAVQFPGLEELEEQEKQ
ncbi:MAG: DNA repair protein RadC [Clostridia bacterium]|nr:DNA repair protein RadC [Clostridia bacterium]